MHQRDARIDSLRGLALCVIAVSHLDFDITRWSWDLLGQVSSAEAFVFLSGLAAGLVYGRLAESAPPRAVWAKALSRARVLYFAYLGLVLFIASYTYGAQALGLDFVPWGGRLLLEDPARALAIAPFFLYQPGFSDILPMYCVFVMLIPPALAQIRRGRARWVLGLSAVLWLAAQLGLYRALLGPVVWSFRVDLPFFDPFAWQLLFVFGLWFGARRAAGRPVPLPGGPATVGLLVALLVIAFAIRHEIFFDGGTAGAVARVTRREQLQPLRLVNFAALAYVTARLGSARPSWLEWRWPAFLGRHSLQVFGFSVAVCYAGQSAKGAGDDVQWLTTAAVVASLTLPAWAHARHRARRRAVAAAGRAPAPSRAAQAFRG